MRDYGPPSLHELLPLVPGALALVAIAWIVIVAVLGAAA